MNSNYMDHIRIHWMSLGMAIAVFILYSLLLIFKPETFLQSLSIWTKFFIFFLPFVVAIIALLGIFEAYVPAEIVSKFLGDKHKLHAYLFSVLFGSITSASHYAIFPAIKMLRKKGARTAVLTTFLVTWSGVSLPLIPLEIQIFGAKFALARISLIVIGAVLIGLITSFLEIHMDS